MVITPDPKADQFDHPHTVISGSLEVTAHPVIVGPSKIPIFTTADDFHKDQELGRLVIMAHSEIPEVRAAWVGGIPDDDDATSYIEDGLYLSSPKNRRHLEAMLETKARPSMTRIGRENYSKGLQEGEERGEARGEAKAVLAVLRGRGLDVTEDQRRVIEETTDSDRLLGWVARAVTVSSVDELLNGD